MFDTVERVYEIAQQNRMSLSRLCSISGVNHSTILTAKKRNGQLTIDTIERICEAVHIPMSEFFSEQ